MIIGFLFQFVGPFALAAYAIYVQRIVREVEAVQLGVLYGVAQLFVLKFCHFSTLGADEMVVGVPIVALFVL